MNGIDVSKWQGGIDWQRVRAAGVEFAMIRVGTGSGHGAYKLDPCFAANMDGALAAGVRVGAYLYSYAMDVAAARGEAAWTLAQLAPYRDRITMPVAYDLEDASQKALGQSTLTAMAKAFCDAVRAGGYIPMLYASADWLRNYIDAPAVGADVWCAQWVNKRTYPGDCAIWQHTNAGRVDGIAGSVDMDVAYKVYWPQPADKPAEGSANVPDAPSAWAAEAWERAKAAGILDGTGPRDPLTREQAAVILDRLRLLKE